MDMLLDPELRKLAGTNVLDTELEEMRSANSTVPRNVNATCPTVCPRLGNGIQWFQDPTGCPLPPRAQSGGFAKHAPFFYRR